MAAGVQALRLRAAVLLSTLAKAVVTVSDEDPTSFVGWQGATFKSGEVFTHIGAQPAMGDGAVEPRIQLLSWKPRAFFWPGFLSHDDADDLIKLARPRMMRSTVVGAGGGVVANIRTSYGAFLRRHSHPVIGKLERRLSAWTMLNISHQEDVQILRYAVGQEYGAHMDTLRNDSPRVCTLLVYLHDTEEGGETAFPSESKWADPALPQRLGPFSQCAEGHVAVKPRKGDALLFYTFNPDGTEDHSALHTGCPVLKGVKWTATVWVHSEPFRPEDLEGSPKDIMDDALWDPGMCQDIHNSCQFWAESGECENNPGYMLGGGGAVGNCRLACKACEVCDPPDDPECHARNRMTAGFLPLEDDAL